MSDLYLIAHKVHGLPAFDIATQLECPECHALGCAECDSLGYWWIIPTSGHRAYPWWDSPINSLAIVTDKLRDCPDLSRWPDHYPSRAAPTISLAEALGIRPKPTPSAPIVRRF